MDISELIVTVMLKEDIPFQQSQEVIGNFLNASMLHDADLKEFHGESDIKGYVYNSFYPLEFKTKTYKANQVYVFRVRSLNKIFLEKMNRCIRKQKKGPFEVIAIEKRTYANKIIQGLYSVTPVVVTVDNQPWLQTDDVDLFIQRLEQNAEKKLKTLLGEEVGHYDFIESIEFSNHKPIGTSYKGIKLLGHKVKVEVKKDEDSQKLAHVVLGAGIGEKNSALGLGFCFGNFI